MTDARAVFRGMLAQGPVLLSGAVGTLLQDRGAPTPLPLWSTAPLLEAPDAVRGVHRDYVKAGAQIVTANTFRTDRRTLAHANLAGRAGELTALALDLARQGVKDAKPRHPVLVAGSIAPLEDCYRPDLVPDEATLRAEHGFKVKHLLQAQAPLALVETMNTTREAVAALGACKAGDLPALVSFTCIAGARLPSGEPVADAMAAVLPLGPLAILVNCCPPPVATEAFRALRGATDLPVGVYAHGRGHPDDRQGWLFARGAWRRRYLAEARTWLAEGAALVGGCCGTDPRLIVELRRLIRRAA